MDDPVRLAFAALAAADGEVASLKARLAEAERQRDKAAAECDEVWIVLGGYGGVCDWGKSAPPRLGPLVAAWRQRAVTAENRLRELRVAVAQGPWYEDEELVRWVTLAVRRADQAFERAGGSSRHWVREHFLPELNAGGLVVTVAEGER